VNEEQKYALISISAKLNPLLKIQVIHALEEKGHNIHASTLSG
jgi:hypothetical protein